MQKIIIKMQQKWQAEQYMYKLIKVWNFTQVLLTANY